MKPDLIDFGQCVSVREILCNPRQERSTVMTGPSVQQQVCLATREDEVRLSGKRVRAQFDELAVPRNAALVAVMCFVVIACAPRGTLGEAAIGPRVVLLLRHARAPQAPTAERSPVDRTRKALQRFALFPADHSRFVQRRIGDQLVEQADLGVAHGRPERRRPGVARLELIHQPGHEEHVAQTRLDGRSAGKKLIRNRIPNAADSQFVACIGLVEQRENLQTALRGSRIVIEPRKL